MGVDHRRPWGSEVQAVQVTAPAPVSPLNSIQNLEEEKTLTLAPPLETPDPVPPLPTVPPRTCTLQERMRRAIEAATLAEAQAPVPGPAAHVPPVPAPAPPPHVETVDRLRRLASPCGPEAVEAAARQVAERLDDLHSLDWHRTICARVPRRGDPREGGDRRVPASTLAHVAPGGGYPRPGLQRLHPRARSDPAGAKTGPRSQLPRFSGGRRKSRTMQAIPLGTSIHGG